MNRVSPVASTFGQNRGELRDFRASIGLAEHIASLRALKLTRLPSIVCRNCAGRRELNSTSVKRLRELRVDFTSFSDEIVSTVYIGYVIAEKLQPVESPSWCEFIRTEMVGDTSGCCRDVYNI